MKAAAVQGLELGLGVKLQTQGDFILLRLLMLETATVKRKGGACQEYDPLANIRCIGAITVFERLGHVHAFDVSGDLESIERTLLERCAMLYRSRGYLPVPDLVQCTSPMAIALTQQTHESPNL